MSEYLMKCLWKGVADVDQQQDAAERIEQLAANNEEMEAKLSNAVEALEFYTYETTHLSAEEDDGSHWCKISKGCLAQARTTLAELKGQDDDLQRT